MHFSQIQNVLQIKNLQVKHNFTKHTFPFFSVHQLFCTENIVQQRTTSLETLYFTPRIKVRKTDRQTDRQNER